MSAYSSIQTLDELLARPDHILFEVVAGSHAYGTAHTNSDRDIRGVFAVPAAAYLSLTPPAPQISDERSDVVYFSLRRFLELAASGNANAIEILHTPGDCVLRAAEAFRPVLESRGRFATRSAAAGLLAFALAQVKKARGRNRWVNRPQPEAPPAKEDFCWIIPAHPSPGTWPGRPVAAADSGLELAECHVASVEHGTNLYRLYHYGSSARGVFRDGNVACESIPREDEAVRYVGLLVYNRTAYEQATRDHQHYWIWRRERNEARWSTDGTALLDYDAKNMMHTFRLLFSCRHLLRTGAPLVRMAGEELAELGAVRRGEFTYEVLSARTAALEGEIRAALAESRLPEECPRNLVDELLFEVTARWEEGDA